MDPFRDLVLGIALPAFISAVGFAWIFLRGGVRQELDSQAQDRVGGSLVFALAAIAGMVAIAGVPAVPPVSVTDGLPWVALTAGVVGLAEGRRVKTRPPSAILRFAVSAAVTGFLLRSRWNRIFDGGDVMGLTLVSVGCTAALTFSWAFADGAVKFWTRAEGAFLWMLTLAASSVVLLRTGNAMMAQFTGALAAALGPAWVLALWRGAPVLGGGAMATVILTGGAFLLTGHFYGELELREVFLVAAAPIGAVLGASFGYGTRNQSLTRILTFGFAVIPLALAVWFSGAQANPYQ